MHILVYGLMGLGALVFGAAVYFALGVSPFEAILAAGLFVALGFALTEHRLRRRTETRLGQAVDELSRLLATEAQAGAALSRRVSALLDTGPEQRLESLEADVAVLGAVVRRVTETVAGMEAGRGEAVAPPPPSPLADDRMADAPFSPDGPLLPIAEIAAALDAEKLVCHVEPIVGLPQRRPRGFDLVPRLALDNGGFLERADFRPGTSAPELARRIDRLVLEEAMAIGRRVRAAGPPLLLHLPLSRASLAVEAAAEILAARLEADSAVARVLRLTLDAAEFSALTAPERENLGRLRALGPTLGLDTVDSLRLDCAALAEAGISSVRVDARALIESPLSLTDFATTDLTAYFARYGIALIVTGVAGEGQIIALLEDGLTLVKGPHIGGPGPARAEQMVGRAGPVAVAGAALPRRAQA